MLFAIPGAALVAASVAVFGGGGLPAPPVSAAAGRTAVSGTPPTKAPGSYPSRPLPAPMNRQRGQELQDLQRQSLATALARFGVFVDWREHDAAELSDWRDRIEAASLLRAEQGFDVDWRTMTMADLNEIRLRAAKAAELAAQGVTVDWRRFSWLQLEEIRRAVARIEAAEAAAGSGGGSAAGRTRKGRSATRGPATNSVRNVPVITDI